MPNKYNNPGNLRFISESDAPFKGEIRPNQNRVWREFISPEYGARAIFKNIETLYNSGYITLRQIMHKYAPYGDGANNPDSYAENLADFAGVSADGMFPIHDQLAFGKIVYRIADIEQGERPDPYMIQRGYVLYTSGTATPNTPVAPSTTPGTTPYTQSTAYTQPYTQQTYYMIPAPKPKYGLWLLGAAALVGGIYVYKKNQNEKRNA